jgi:hypothetical protein
VLHREIIYGLPRTIAADDVAGVHFINTKFAEVVSSRPKARAYVVRLID